jgi:SET domain-containing protein 6
MRTIKRIAAGEEIFNDYGPLPRSELLRRYGYITPNYTKYDVVDIPYGLFEDTAKTLFGFSSEFLETKVYSTSRPRVDIDTDKP